MRRLVFLLFAFAIQAKAQEIAKPVNLVGDETLLATVKANPKKYIGRPFIMTGGAEVSDYYNYEYNRAEGSHCSLTFHQILSAPPISVGERCHIYLRKTTGKAVIDEILKTTAGASNTRKLIRVKVAIEPARFSGANSWKFLELLDVQFSIADGGWEPWYFENIKARQEQAALVEAKASEVANKLLQMEQDQERERQAKERKAARTRIWRDASGKFSVEAEFLGYGSGAVRLKKTSDESELKVKYDALSKNDQE